MYCYISGADINKNLTNFDFGPRNLSIQTILDSDSTVDRDKIRDMLDSLIESLKSKMFVDSSEMAAFGGNELIEEMPTDTEQNTSGGQVVVEESPSSDEEPAFVPAMETESDQSVSPKRDRQWCYEDSKLIY